MLSRQGCQGRICGCVHGLQPLAGQHLPYLVYWMLTACSLRVAGGVPRASVPCPDEDSLPLAACPPSPFVGLQLSCAWRHAADHESKPALPSFPAVVGKYDTTAEISPLIAASPESHSLKKRDEYDGVRCQLQRGSFILGPALHSLMPRPHRSYHSLSLR